MRSPMPVSKRCWRGSSRFPRAMGPGMGKGSSISSRRGRRRFGPQGYRGSNNGRVGFRGLSCVDWPLNPGHPSRKRPMKRRAEMDEPFPIPGPRSSRWDAAPLRVPVGTVDRGHGIVVTDSRFESAHPCDVALTVPWARSDRERGETIEIHRGAAVAGSPPGSSGSERWAGRNFGPGVCCLARNSGAPVPQEADEAPR